MVVAAIVGTLVAVAMLAWRTDPGRVLAADAERLAARLELAQSRATITGARLGFVTSERGYGFRIRSPGGDWQDMDADTPLGQHPLDRSLRMGAVRLAGVVLAPGELVVLGGHDAPPLAVAIEGPGARATVASGAWAGRMDVHVERSGE